MLALGDRNTPPDGIEIADFELAILGLVMLYYTLDAGFVGVWTLDIGMVEGSGGMCALRRR